MNSSTYIAKSINDIKKLKELKKEIDPASGISICVRRGIFSDLAEVENDRPLREWIEMELCENMEEIIEILLDAQIKSLKFSVCLAKSNLKDITKAIQMGEEFIEKL